VGVSQEMLWLRRRDSSRPRGMRRPTVGSCYVRSDEDKAEGSMSIVVNYRLCRHMN
jgi:hypothetical protein